MIVWDNHTCMPLRPGDESFLPQLQRFRDAGVNVVSVNAGFGEQTPEQHLRMLAHFRRWISQRPEAYCLVSTAHDAVRAAETGKLGVFFDIEGARAIGDQLSLIQLYYDLGVRWMCVAYNLNNAVGGGCMDDDPGLSEFGYRFVDEMERVGMAVCVSHTGARTARDVLAYAKRPVIFSHSNPAALNAHARNIGDDLILACAKTGGVVGINGVGRFHAGNDASAQTLARNVDYVVKLAGIDHVGIGLDFVFDNDEVLEYIKKNPALFGAPAGASLRLDDEPFAPPETIPQIADCLPSMGYAQSDLAKVMGGNWLRLAQEMWR